MNEVITNVDDYNAVGIIVEEENNNSYGVNTIINDNADSPTTYGAGDVATPENDGLMSAADKSKLDGISPGANYYEHPNNLNTRHVSDSQMAIWNAKASTSAASTTSAGLMSAADKAKIDSVESGATNYIHPDGADTRHVTDAEKETWNAKANTTAATSSAAGLMSAADKTKLDGVATGANNYIHPNDANTRHVTDEEKASWNAKANTTAATSSAAGLMSSTDKTKLDGVATGANNYIHPNDANTRHVTDEEKASWNAKANTTAATSSAAGLMSSTDKTKLDGVATGANNYIHPNDANTRHVTDAEKASWNNKLNSGQAAGGVLIGTYPNPSIGAGKVTNDNLAGGITENKLAGNIPGSKLAAGVIPATLPPSGKAGGVLAGTYPNPTLAANSVTLDKLSKALQPCTITESFYPIAVSGRTVMSLNNILTWNPTTGWQTKTIKITGTSGALIISSVLSADKPQIIPVQVVCDTTNTSTSIKVKVYGGTDVVGIPYDAGTINNTSKGMNILFAATEKYYIPVSSINRTQDRVGEFEQVGQDAV